MVAVTLVPLDPNKVEMLQAWLGEDRAALLIGVLNANRVYHEREAGHRLVEFFRTGDTGQKVLAESMAEEAYWLQHFLNLIRDMQQGYHGNDETNAFDYLTEG